MDRKTATHKNQKLFLFCLLLFSAALRDELMPHFLLRCLDSRFMKQQVTAAMMTMPTNRADETPMTRGIRSRSAAGDRRTETPII